MPEEQLMGVVKIAPPEELDRFQVDEEQERILEEILQANRERRHQQLMAWAKEGIFLVGSGGSKY